MDYPFTLDQLTAFAAVVDEGGFAAAGRRTGRVQSAVSHAVKALEAALGVKLFQKSGRRAVLTEDGRLLLEEARLILEAAGELYGRSRALSGASERAITLCVDPLYPASCLADAAAGFNAVFPQLSLRLTSSSLAAVAETVRAGRADLGITGPVGRLEGLEAAHLLDVHLVPVCAPHHPLAGVGSAARSRFARFPQIVIPDRSGATTGDHGILSPQTWEVDDWATKAELIRAGLAFGNLPRHAIEAELASGALVVLRPRAWSPDEHRLPLRMVRQRGRPRGPAARWLAEQLASLTAG